MFDLVHLKGYVIKSPFYFAPINTGLVRDGNPTEDLISFHRNKSNEYTGINYVGNVAISKRNTTNSRTLYINDMMVNYESLAREIESNGSLPGAQIACYQSEYIPNVRFKTKNVHDYISFIRREISMISTEEIKKVISEFTNGIRRLYNSGYKVVQIHGAHGYFLNNFISNTFNSREDDFGKDKLLVVREILNGISDISKSLIIDLRISLYETDIKSDLHETNREFLDEIYSIDSLDIISISNGIYNIDKSLIYPNKSSGQNFMIGPLQNYVAERADKVWNLSGNIRNLERLPLHLKNMSYSIGRPIVADNDFVLKYFTDRKLINHCNYCNKCHYYSRGKDFIECPVNQNLF